MVRLRSFVRPYKWAFVLAPLMMVLEVAMDLLQPMFLATIINEGLQGGDQGVIARTGGMMLIAAVFGLIGGVGCTYFSNQAAQGMGGDLRVALFARIQALSFRQIDHFQTGSLITRITNDVMQVLQLIQLALRVFVRNISLLAGSVLMTIVISPRLSLVLLAVIPLLTIILYILTQRALPLFARLQQRLDRVNVVLQENISGIRLIKSFVRGDHEVRRFSVDSEAYFQTAQRAFRTVALNMPLMTMVLNFGLVLILWMGGASIWNEQMQVGDLAAFLTYMTHILFSIVSIGNMIMNASRAKVSADRIREILNVEEDLPDTVSSERVAPVQEDIVFEGVSFGYGTDQREWVLKDIDLRIPKGATVGILGATGAGKSTLIHLMARMYDVSAGAIRIGGVDIRDISLDDLRSRMALVLQKNTLFSGTIRDNICFGVEGATEEEIQQAARAACAEEFIMRLPQGYDTIVGQRGVNLSGGQKQRLSLARAFILQPFILVLDDSTSAVDLRTEAAINQALRKRREQAATTLIIAQRITSVIDADFIVILEQGKIAAVGTHAELLADSQIYQEICHSQIREEEIDHVR